MDKHLKIAKFLTKLLDEQFEIFGFKFGLDPIIGLLPVGGDVIGFLVSLYLVWIGIKLELPKIKIWTMIKNTALDFLLGLIPFIGDGLDFVYKSNKMNMKIVSDFAGNIVDGEVIS